MEAVTVTIPGKPVPYARARHHGKKHWKPTAHAQWEALAVALMRGAFRGQGERWAGPLAVQVVAVYPRPVDTPKREGLGRLKRPSTKGDLDNVVKLCLDAAVKAGWMVDDNHVQQLAAERYHAAEGEGPSVTVRMWRVQ